MDAYGPNETNDKAVTRISSACSSVMHAGQMVCKSGTPYLCRELVAGAACQGETQPLQGACSAAQHMGCPYRCKSKAVLVIHSRPHGTQESKHWFSEWESVFPPLRGKQHTSSFPVPVAKLCFSPVLARWSAQSKDWFSPFLKGGA